MSYKSSFLDNMDYGATDINNRLKKYVTSGVADSFVDGVPFNNSKFNDMTIPISTKGVVPESVTTCKCSINKTDKTVTIANGTCFFENGTEIEIVNHTMPYVAGVKNYVYVKSDLAANTIAPYCSTVAPVGDYVPLAEVSTDEVLTDKRIYAKGKLLGYQSDFNKSLKTDFTKIISADDSTIITEVLALDGVYENFVFKTKTQTSSYFSWGTFINGQCSAVYGVRRYQEDDVLFSGLYVMGVNGSTGAGQLTRYYTLFLTPTVNPANKQELLLNFKFGGLPHYNSLGNKITVSETVDLEIYAF